MRIISSIFLLVLRWRWYCDALISFLNRKRIDSLFWLHNNRRMSRDCWPERYSTVLSSRLVPSRLVSSRSLYDNWRRKIVFSNDSTYLLMVKNHRHHFQHNSNRVQLEKRKDFKWKSFNLFLIINLLPPDDIDRIENVFRLSSLRFASLNKRRSVEKKEQNYHQVIVCHSRPLHWTDQHTSTFVNALTIKKCFRWIFRQIFSFWRKKFRNEKVFH